MNTRDIIHGMIDLKPVTFPVCKSIAQRTELERVLVTTRRLTFCTRVENDVSVTSCSDESDAVLILFINNGRIDFALMTAMQRYIISAGSSSRDARSQMEDGVSEFELSF